MTNSFFHFRPFHVPWQNYAGDLAALLQTIGFTIAGFLGAIAIGLLVAVLRLAPWPPLRTIARIYTETFKNLPLVSEIFLVYFGLATIGIVLNVFVAGAISLAIFYGAYLSEIFRAGLQGVGRGQREAAQALGYDEARRFITRSGLLCAYRTDAAFEADRFGIELRRRRGVQLEASARPRADIGRSIRRGRWGNRHAEVLHLKAKDRQPAALATTAGLHVIDRLVIAAWAWSGPLAMALGAQVPLETERGYIVVLPDVARRPQMPFLAVDRHIAVTPMDTGLRVAGTVEFAGLNAGPNPRRADALLESVSPFLGPLNSRDAMRWMSFRPSMPDSLPVIGWAPGHSRAFFAFGHGHLGPSLAAVTGKLTAEAMAGRPLPVDITSFRPGRWLQNGSIAQPVN